MNEERIPALQLERYYERIEKLLNGGKKETYGFVPEEIRGILRAYEYTQQERQQLAKEIDMWNTKYNKEFDKTQYLKKRMDKAIEKLQLLIDIGFDYDGFNQPTSLKGLIDELVGYARESRNILKGDNND